MNKGYNEMILWLSVFSIIVTVSYAVYSFLLSKKNAESTIYDYDTGIVEAEVVEAN